MARASLDLVRALDATATLVASSATYKWSSFGQCNCGHLAQVITGLGGAAIQRAAFGGSGDWGAQAREVHLHRTVYRAAEDEPEIERCAVTGWTMDRIVGALFAAGLDHDDLGHLERLSDPRVLARIDGGAPTHHRREDVVRYLRAFADLLRAELPQDREAECDLPLAAE